MITPNLSNPIVDFPQTNTTVAACTYVKKSDCGCLNTTKQTRRLHDACIDDFLSKWTNEAPASLSASDVFASFYYVSPMKKLCSLLLPWSKTLPWERMLLLQQPPTQLLCQNSMASPLWQLGTYLP